VKNKRSPWGWFSSCPLKGKTHLKNRTFAWGGVNLNGAAVFFDDPASNGETKSAPRGMARVLCWPSIDARLIDSVEALEEIGQVRGLNARSLIDDLETCVALLPVEFHFYLFANLSAVFEGILQQIEAELRQVEPVTPDYQFVQTCVR
jgi:hypothetical protein